MAWLSVAGATHAEAAPAEAGFAPRLTIYLAKGAPDICGPGCDRWIAIEGAIDQGAARRIRRFLAAVKETQRPIYFHSPGGNVEQSFAIGRLLRSRKAIGRVGRTIATSCGAGSQVDSTCLNIKSAAGEIEADLTTYHAMCNSACAYLMLGATSREVAPDAALAVHNSRLVLSIHGHPPPQALAEWKTRWIANAARDRAAYVAAMGISRELDDLIKTVKFEDLHMLTRSELYRFGIDTRPMAESMWRVEKGARPYVSKFAMLRQEGGVPFRMMEWRVYCEASRRVPLTFTSEIAEARAGRSTVLITAAADAARQAGGAVVRSGKYETWSGAIDPAMIKTMLASRTLQVRESWPAPDGKEGSATFELDTSGLASAWSQLAPSCPAETDAPKNNWPASPPQGGTASPTSL